MGTESYGTRVLVRKGKQLPDGKKTSLTATFTAEKWSGAILTSSEATAKEGRYR
jgi:hypothetical protein